MFHQLKICALLCVLHSGTALAAVSEDWESGLQAFQNGDYQSALLFFQTARDQGLDGPAVHYNIAVSQFKLRRYQAAGVTFELIADRFPAMRGLAEYNLGLVDRRLGNRAAARAHFRRAYELSSGDRKIRALASRQIRELSPAVRTASRWRGAIGVRAGHDDNVALRDEAGLPVGMTGESPMTDVFGTIRGPWNGRNGFRVEGSAYLVKYFDADEFDQSQFRGAASYEWRPSDWRLQLGVHATAGSLGGDAFDRKVGPHARIVRDFGGSGSLELRYSYDEVSEGDSVYAPIAGSRQQIDTRYRWSRNGHWIQLRYWLETNDREDPALSPDRSRVLASYRYQPETGIGYEAGVDVRTSEYDDIATPRKEDLTTFRTGLTYMLRNDWLLMLEYRKSDNDSTDAAFSYDRTQVLLGAMKLF